MPHRGDRKLLIGNLNADMLGEAFIHLPPADTLLFREGKEAGIPCRGTVVWVAFLPFVPLDRADV
jgi:hypothetical protein